MTSLYGFWQKLCRAEELHLRAVYVYSSRTQISGNFCLCMAFVYLSQPRLPFSRCSSPEMPSFFFDISSGSVCFWHTLQHAGPCVLFAIQLWSVLNCRGSKLHKEGSYLCNITQSADSTDFKEHLKRGQERDSVEIVFKVVTFSKASVM